MPSTEQSKHDSSGVIRSGLTFAAQHRLPKLPIPDLEGTCRRYLETLLPLQSAKEHYDTVKAVKEFLGSTGPQLQDRLKRYAEGKPSYIEQFCMTHTSTPQPSTYRYQVS